MSAARAKRVPAKRPAASAKRPAAPAKRPAAPAKRAAPHAAPLSVVILAAGQGTRMRSALPKVLQPLAGQPLLAHVIATARALDPAAIHVVYGHGGDEVRTALAAESVSWVLQAEQLGTGHAVQQVAGRLPDGHRVLILYGDVPLLSAATLRDLLRLADSSALGVLTAHLEDPSGYGRVVRDARGRVRRIVEQRDASARERALTECNTGVMAAPAARLKRWVARLRNDNAQSEFYLTDVIAQAVREGCAVRPLPAPSAEEVLGVNDKVELARAESVLRRRRVTELMLAGATVIDPARLDVRGSVELGRDVVLDVNVVLEGRVRLGDRVRIGPNCCLRDSAIGADTQVHANCVIDHAEIGADCRIGPFARIRPQSVLEAQAHIGNFVELKNTRVGAGSKANHLTYLGDATVGAGVNVGAGTVTCNYDGANKWPTQIGDGAFIGSGAMLVAPVRIGAHATIGAGSTITQDAPPERLSVARARQVTIEGWQRPKKRT
jgi:bifunctional UDP-N-acetylglucosamine pyrophosphorylase / glucosamine-1-phosphate N-acetyltransferase